MITTYTPPLRDLAFALDVVGELDAGLRYTMVELLDEFGRFCADVIAPLNQSGDRAGVQFDAATGRVTTAAGWSDAYAKYVAADWNTVSFDPAYGGGGFPLLLTAAMQEELHAASTAFALCPMLTQCAVHMLQHHGTAAQQARYLAQLVSGESTGTMVLTEPSAGSNVGAVVTRAEPAADGSWRINGQKIFITYGEHDLTEQTVHIVLARTPGAPRGTKGISCFLVPKVLDDGRRNAVRCIGVEQKMGLHASPTCVLEFDGAVAELIGEPHQGMRYMFTMMNNARLAVAVQGLGVAMRAYQAAVTYAKERVQGHVACREPGATIIEHPDVRRMVLHMRSHIEAMRLLTYRTAAALDSGDRAIADLLTPIAKAWCTDVAAEVTRLATQVVGGAGYIREMGVEQHERDVRIGAIYEGTNGIQAVHLVTRQLDCDDGAAMRRLLTEIATTAEKLNGSLGARLAESVDFLRAATDWVRTMSKVVPRDALAGATPYLCMAGTTIAACLLAQQALRAQDGADRDPFFAAKISTAQYFLDQVLPQAVGLFPSVTAGAANLDAIPAHLL